MANSCEAPSIVYNSWPIVARLLLYPTVLDLKVLCNDWGAANSGFLLLSVVAAQTAALQLTLEDYY